MNIPKTIFIILLNLSFNQNSLNVDLLFNYDYDFGVNDIWGYETNDNREFAIVGTESGTSIIEILDNTTIERGFIEGGPSTWRDIKSYGEYIYIGTENSNGGVQIVSMQDPDNPVLVNTFTRVGNSHNLMIDNGYLYIMGASDVGYLIIASLEDPQNPEQIGIWNEEYLHDICINQNILYGCGIYSGVMFAIDISDPQNPITINYWTDVPSAHACWTTDDGNYVLTASERESGHIMIWDVNDLDNVNLISEWTPLGAEWDSAHNIFIRDQYAYISYYRFGLQIIDITYINQPTLAGYYDTFLNDEDGGLYSGAWGVYPFQQSCNIYISDRSSGLYVVDFNGCNESDLLDPMPPSNLNVFSNYETPNSVQINWTNPEQLYDGTSLDNFLIKIYRNEELIQEVNNASSYNDFSLIDGNYYKYDLLTLDLNTDSVSTSISSTVYSGGSPFPSPPMNFSVNIVENGMELSWVNPSTQSDNTYLDDLKSVRVYRNDSFIFEQNGVNNMEMTFIDNPLEGYFYKYSIVSIDNEEPENLSEFSEEINIFYGSNIEYLIWEPNSNSSLSGLEIKNDLDYLNKNAYLSNDLLSFGNLEDNNFKAIFVINGIWPNNHILSDYEKLVLMNYLETGGNIYLEDADIWYNDFDNQFSNYFNCIGSDDGNGDITNLVGIAGTFASEFETNYNGENNSIDRLLFSSSAFPIINNDNPIYSVMVANDNDDYRTLASTVEYGGFENIFARRTLLETMLYFFDNGGHPDWLVGDSNQDNVIDILDVIIIIDYILTIIVPEPIEYWLGNVNKDDEINLLDVILLVEQILD